VNDVERPKSARCPADADDESSPLLRAVAGESCQISCPCPEKLSAPEPVRTEGSTDETCESAGGNPITDVCGRAASPCITKMVGLPGEPEDGLPKYGAWVRALPDAEFERGAEEACGRDAAGAVERAGAE
jgi:hypothetical protein